MPCAIENHKYNTCDFCFALTLTSQKDSYEPCSLYPRSCNTVWSCCLVCLLSCLKLAQTNIAFALLTSSDNSRRSTLTVDFSCSAISEGSPATNAHLSRAGDQPQSDPSSLQVVSDQLNRHLLTHHLIKTCFLAVHMKRKHLC